MIHIVYASISICMRADLYVMHADVLYTRLLACLRCVLMCFTCTFICVYACVTYIGPGPGPLTVAGLFLKKCVLGNVACPIVFYMCAGLCCCP